MKFYVRISSKLFRKLQLNLRLEESQRHSVTNLGLAKARRSSLPLFYILDSAHKKKNEKMRIKRSLKFMLLMIFMKLLYSKIIFVFIEFS